MSSRIRVLPRWLATVIALTALPALAGEKAWELRLDGIAPAGGAVVLAVTTEDGAVQHVPVEIRAEFPEVRNSRVLAQALLRTLGKTWRVERPEDDRILVRRLDGAPFTLGIVSNSATGLKLDTVAQ